MKRWFLALSPVLWLLPSCVLHEHSSEHSGIPGVRGEPIEYQVTTTVGLQGLFLFDLWGDASVEASVKEFSAEASARGATRADIQRVNTTVLWYVLPPISFLIHPVVTDVQGSIEGTSTED